MITDREARAKAEAHLAIAGAAAVQADPTKRWFTLYAYGTDTEVRALADRNILSVGDHRGERYKVDSRTVERVPADKKLVLAGRTKRRGRVDRLVTTHTTVLSSLPPRWQKDLPMAKRR